VESGRQLRLSRGDLHRDGLKFRRIDVHFGGSLAALYDVDVRVAKVEPLPAATLYAARGRYRAEKLLERLTALHASAFRVLGVTARPR
jgi:hypothetical protein